MVLRVGLPSENVNPTVEVRMKFNKKDGLQPRAERKKRKKGKKEKKEKKEKKGRVNKRVITKKRESVLAQVANFAPGRKLTSLEQLKAQTTDVAKESADGFIPLLAEQREEPSKPRKARRAIMHEQLKAEKREKKRLKRERQVQATNRVDNGQTESWEKE